MTEAKANNITCPKCKSENCFVTEDDECVQVECKDCGYLDQCLKDE